MPMQKRLSSKCPFGPRGSPKDDQAVGARRRRGRGSGGHVAYSGVGLTESRSERDIEDSARSIQAL